MVQLNQFNLGGDAMQHKDNYLIAKNRQKTRI